MKEELRNLYLENHFAGDYRTNGLIVLPVHLDEYGIQTFVEIAKETYKDTVAIKLKGNVQGVRYIPRTSNIPKVGDFIANQGNHETTLGEGLYLYSPISLKFFERILSDTQAVIALKGKDVDYYRIDAFAGEDKTAEIVITKDSSMEVIGVFENREDYLRFRFPDTQGTYLRGERWSCAIYQEDESGTDLLKRTNNFTSNGY